MTDILNEKEIGGAIVINIKADLDLSQIESLFESAKSIWPRNPIAVIEGDIATILDESAMNELGWFRQAR